MSQEEGELTGLLIAYREGDDAAMSKMMSVVYADLRRIARRQLKRTPPGQTLNTSALVHESFVRLLGRDRRLTAQNRNHFMSMAALAMRHIVVDAVRKRLALKRGGGLENVEFKDSIVASPSKEQEVLAIDESLRRLAEIDERLVKLVELRFFAGLSEQESSEILGISRRTLQRDWKRAKAWLQKLLKED